MLWAWHDERQFRGYGYEARVAGDSRETQLTLTRLMVWGWAVVQSALVLVLCAVVGTCAQSHRAVVLGRFVVLRVAQSAPALFPKAALVWCALVSQRCTWDAQQVLWTGSVSVRLCLSCGPCCDRVMWWMAVLAPGSGHAAVIR